MKANSALFKCIHRSATVQHATLSTEEFPSIIQTPCTSYRMKGWFALKLFYARQQMFWCCNPRTILKFTGQINSPLLSMGLWKT